MMCAVIGCPFWAGWLKGHRAHPSFQQTTLRLGLSTENGARLETYERLAVPK